jgi:hypothetical protein
MTDDKTLLALQEATASSPALPDRDYFEII